MKYRFEEFTIKKLFDLVDNNHIDLNPSYQRNFIWSGVNQKELIDTILRQYPVPSLCIYESPNGKYEMVDGQQRTKTIYRFIKGEITSSKEQGSVPYSKIDQEVFLNYRLPVIILYDLTGKDSLKDFYVLINKKGVHLNPAEVNKSEFHDTNFLKLANELLTYQNLINLDLFTDATSKRMNDRAFVEEILGYLIIGGPKDKRKAVEDIYKSDITAEESKDTADRFKAIIDRIQMLNEVHPLSKTRYKQKNDFYTLFSFVNQSTDNDQVLKYQYKILLVLDRDDADGRQFIRPSNDDCMALKDYATNCITQSNSKTARDNRLRFFNEILRNTETSKNDALIDVLNYLSSIYGDDRIQLKKIEHYELLNIDNL